MKNILIIGKNAYLATGLEFDKLKYSVDKILRPFETDFEKYNEYDYIINFCIQPEHFCSLLPEEEMIDVQIAKHITNKNTKFVFSSSRKVYGSNCVLKTYKETDELKPFDFYSKNKVNIESALQEIIPNNLLIMRTGNIIGKPSNRKNYATFIGWLESELKKNGKVVITVDKNSKKDFITKEYFQESIIALIENDATGIYNIGSNFALSIDELILSILPSHLVEFSPKENNSEQFILNCEKLHQVNRKLTIDEFKIACRELGKTLMNECVRI